MSCFAFLACMAFALTLSQPMHFLTFTVLSPIPPGDWASGCVELSCQLGLHHDTTVRQILLSYLKRPFQRTYYYLKGLILQPSLFKILGSAQKFCSVVCLWLHITLSSFVPQPLHFTAAKNVPKFTLKIPSILLTRTPGLAILWSSEWRMGLI